MNHGGFAVLTLSWLTASLALEAVEIRSDFPGGNVIIVENEGTTARLKPDLRGGRDWFYWHFEATASEPGEIEFVFEGALRIGISGPAVSEDGGVNWRWLGIETVQYSAKEAGKDAVESFRFPFERKGQKVRFAVAIPYLQRDLDAFLNRVEGNPHLKRSELTRSKSGRSVELLQIGEPGPGKESIILTARHHACESMASYVLEGFLAEALSGSPAAIAFREKYVVHAVPMMDKDGVEAGDQGKWRFPHDHNRDYGQNSLYPEVQAIQNLAREVRVALALDFHCPSLRGETHEVFYFIGVGLPHLQDNTEELRRWIDEERPQSIRAGPFNFMRDPPPTAPDAMNAEKFSVWFAYLEGVRYAATFEIPYAQAAGSFDAATARDYGAATLRAWERSEFVADPGSRSPLGFASLLNFRKRFAAEHQSRPEETEGRAAEILGDPKAPGAMKAEAEISIGLLRLSQRRHREAVSRFDGVLNHPGATTRQKLTAATRRVLAICGDKESDSGAVEEALRVFESFPHPSAAARHEALGAISRYFEQGKDSMKALELARRQLPWASAIQKGENLNRIADLCDHLERNAEALSARKAAVAHLREQLDPVPVGIFGAMMGRDLFEALQGIPDSTLDEKRAAADIVLNHKVASKEIKERVRAALETISN